MGIPRGRGILKVKFLEAKYEAKLEFPGGRGCINKKPSVGEVWIFSGTAQSKFTLIEWTPSRGKESPINEEVHPLTRLAVYWLSCGSNVIIKFFTTRGLIKL